MSILDNLADVAVSAIPEVVDYFTHRNRPRTSDLDCQESKNHEDLDIACQNQGAIQDGAHELEPSYIMKKYQTTGQLPQMIGADPTYGDFSQPLDYISAHQILEKANEQFGALDAHVRSRFENDPAQFLAFATDERNKEEMRKMGLTKPLPEQTNQEQPKAAVPPPLPA